MQEKIIILDFGGQYAHLIASRIRRLNVLAEIRNADDVNLEKLEGKEVKGIILSGGPQSVYDSDSPRCDRAVFETKKPILGICYGHQFVSHTLGGEVTPGKIKEYGRAEVHVDWHCPLFSGIPEDSVFWMSHGDEVTTLPVGFVPCAASSNCTNAAVWHPEKKIFGIQFHPEVTHSEYGNKLLDNFLDICAVKRDWTMERFLADQKINLTQKVGDRNVLLFVSGGVDSTVSFAFLSEILGANRVKGLFVDTGLLRAGEVEFVEAALKNMGAEVTVLRESDRFLENLDGVYEPEKKREIIGNTFLDVQRDYFADHKLGMDWVLAQGTIYPDTIETGATKHSATIKTHHNRVPEIQKMIDAGQVIEPIAELYKDEVRTLGELLGLPHELVWRHPFPGPGLGVRILCSGESFDETLDEIEDATVLPIKSVGVQGDFRTYRHPAVIPRNNHTLTELEQRATNLINTNADVNRAIVLLASSSKEELKHGKVQQCCINPERIARLQQSDKIVTDALMKSNLYEKVWQFPVVLIPISFNGKGGESIVLRPINSIDAMSASVGDLGWEFFENLSQKILEDTSISAVFLDVTSKPPGTIEWE